MIFQHGHLKENTGSSEGVYSQLCSVCYLIAVNCPVYMVISRSSKFYHLSPYAPVYYVCYIISIIFIMSRSYADHVGISPIWGVKELSICYVLCLFHDNDRLQLEKKY
ncbi:hypothetical protein Cni_G25279 [Canna indica]|uniref:Uncharacterized protein n=1 Tax=Canna indica TaxID=4628 RepID=A0AAQ3KZS4_9LILI|nr:hypothetical protein Cni_G25279 [Canna indica]